jgi:hypothetical protein
MVVYDCVRRRGIVACNASLYVFGDCETVEIPGSDDQEFCNAVLFEGSLFGLVAFVLVS